MIPESGGLTLQQACAAYASGEIAQRLRQTSENIRRSSASKWWETHGNQSLAETVSKITTAALEQRERQEAVNAAYDHLLALLASGQLKATGIRTLPVVETAPGPIPTYLFDKPQIDWQNDTVANAGSKFEFVRVHGREARIERQIGRPSKRSAIERLINELADRGLDLTRDQARICDQVRERARHEGLTLDGFSDSVIKPLIRQVREGRS